ncbi:hypothetical protein PIB30_018834 [Stylosanthes scabra]|uniref:SHSP domain-containing protein n=1 Tax=Stylosanthes scabra TaxID=79078 RepID=A0ABU6T9R5_9FABA|nr:hypothetical protein [Stylosanthes scabra]
MSLEDNSGLENREVDWKETDEAHMLTADMTGVNKEEVKVEVEEGGVLQISGERSVEREEQNGDDGTQLVQRATARFTRSFTLPANSRTDQVKASIENGVLTVTVPKDDLNLLRPRAVPN